MEQLNASEVPDMRDEDLGTGCFVEKTLPAVVTRHTVLLDMVQADGSKQVVGTWMGLDKCKEVYPARMPWWMWLLFKRMTPILVPTLQKTE
jgi:hypothetical protein